MPNKKVFFYKIAEITFSIQPVRDGSTNTFCLFEKNGIIFSKQMAESKLERN